MLVTPFHTAVVEWAHQNSGRWDKDAKAWLVPDTAAVRDSLEQLCRVLWPSGIATSQGGGGPRRARHSVVGQAQRSGPPCCVRCQAATSGPNHYHATIASLPLCSPCYIAVLHDAALLNAPVTSVPA